MIDWQAYMPLARAVAGRVFRTIPRGRASRAELEQDALIGLHQAAAAFDPARRVKFETFATRRIRGAVIDGLRDRDVLTRGQRARGALEPRSLDGRGRAAEGRDAGIVDAGAEEPGRAMAEASVLERVAGLLPDPVMASVVRLRFGEGLRMWEIGRRVGLSGSRVSQLLSCALRALRGSVSVTPQGELEIADTDGRSHVSQNGSQNGNGALARRGMATPDLPAVQELQEPPPWLKALRDAMAGSITGEDVKEVMAAQVQKAKDGDMKAAAFVMGQAHKLMQADAKRPPVTIVQNNYYDTPADERPDVPLEPGDDDRGKDLRKLRSRARAGVPVTGRADDRRVRPVSDEEEKELRRLEQEREDELAAARGPEGD